MAKINQLTFEFSDNYAVYDDCDSMTDYFHMYSGSLKAIIRAVKESGADKIICEVCNDSPEIPSLKRAKRVARECGYDLEDKSADRTYNSSWDGKKITRYHYEYVLTKQA